MKISGDIAAEIAKYKRTKIIYLFIFKIARRRLSKIVLTTWRSR